MLNLSKKTEYALIALTHLACEPDCVSSARRIAEQYNMPLPLLMNILKKLARLGLVRSVRGAKGGYALCGDANQITLDRLIDAIEGPVRLVECSHTTRTKSPGRCSIAGCPVRPVVRDLHRRIEKLLSQITLAEIAQNHAATTGLGQRGARP